MLTTIIEVTLHFSSNYNNLLAFRINRFFATRFIRILIVKYELTKDIFCSAILFLNSLCCVCLVKICENPLVIDVLGMKIRGGILLFACLTVFCLIIVTQIVVPMK